MSAVLTITSIPPELLDTIFDYLEPEGPTCKDDLRACSLVSRTWNALVKPHLFRTISLTFRHPATYRRVYQEHIPGIHDVEDRPNWKEVDDIRIPRRTLADINDFFSRSPIVPSYIHDLRLVQFPSRISSDVATSAHWYTEDDDCSLELLLHILSSLPRLFTLRLNYFVPRVAETFPVVRRGSLAGELSTISRLFIDLVPRNVSAAEARLDALLGYLDDISELHLSSFTSSVTQSEPEQLRHPCLRHQRYLKVLTLDNCTMKPSFFDAVRESPAADAIEVLDLRPIRSPTEPDIRAISASDALVKRIGPHLKSFRYWIDPSEAAINFSTFTTLQTLTLCLELQTTAWGRSLDMLKPIVINIPASVEHLHFQVSAAMTANAQIIIIFFLSVFRGLDPVLAEKIEHSSLRKIYLVFCPERFLELNLDDVCTVFSMGRPQFERLAALGIHI